GDSRPSARPPRPRRFVQGERALVVGGHRLGRRSHLLLPRALHGADRLQDRTTGGRAAAQAYLPTDARKLRGGLRYQLLALLRKQRHRLARLNLFRHAARHPLRLRVGDQPAEELEEHSLFLHLDPVPAPRRDHRPALHPVQPRWRPPVPRVRPRPAELHARAHRPLHRDELADRDLDAALLLRGGATGRDRRFARRWRRGMAADHPDRPADGDTRHRRDRLPLDHLRLERVLLRLQPRLGRQLHRTHLHAPLCHLGRALLGQAGRLQHHGRPPDRAPRLGCPAAARPRSVDGSGQV
ncbi:MAG: Various polyols ABC transporter, permease protein 2, partial [uncultured Thermomicrobiales bacterium]